AQCERFFLAHPGLKRVPAEDTAGSVREVLASGDKSAAGVAGRQRSKRYGGVILAESIQENAENFTRFVLLVPERLESGPGSENAPADLLVDLRMRRREQATFSPMKLSLALR